MVVDCFLDFLRVCNYLRTLDCCILMGCFDVALAGRWPITINDAIIDLTMTRALRCGTYAVDISGHVGVRFFVLHAGCRIVIA